MTAASAGPYPASFFAGDDTQIARWRPLAQWLLAIPQMMVAGALEYAAGMASVIAWFIILFTGRLPEGLANFMAMSIRYSQRANGYSMGLTEAYPPFTFDSVAADPGNYVIGADFVPELEDRNRVTVFFRIFLLIPAMIVGLLWILVQFVVGAAAWFAVLFTGTYPEGMRRTVVKVFNWTTRVNAYAFLLTDRFTPLGLD